MFSLVKLFSFGRFTVAVTVLAMLCLNAPASAATGAGSFDETYRPALAAGAWVQQMALGPDGRLYVCGGKLATLGGIVRDTVRFEQDGTLDPTWLAQPVSGLHVSVVQALPSSQVGAVPGAHAPAWQVSSPLQASASGHGVPSVTAGN